MARMSRPVVTLFLLVVAGVAQGTASDGLLILQTNDVDPTAPTSQPNGRWYHWLEPIRQSPTWKRPWPWMPEPTPVGGSGSTFATRRRWLPSR